MNYGTCTFGPSQPDGDQNKMATLRKALNKWTFTCDLLTSELLFGLSRTSLKSNFTESSTLLMVRYSRIAKEYNNSTGTGDRRRVPRVRGVTLTRPREGANRMSSFCCLRRLLSIHNTLTLGKQVLSKASALH